MKKRYLLNIIVILGCLFLSSCDDYLDIKPKGKLLEEDAFSSEKGFQKSLNGIYARMCGANLYGGSLTMTTVEVLAQRYNVNESDHSWYFPTKYNYTDPKARVMYDGIWVAAYVNILNINKLIENLDLYDDVLSAENKDLIKGEAIALRAMHHFDLLRLYGPIYSEGSDKEAIPYQVTAKAEMTATLTADKVMEAILADLTLAEQLLANDPVREYGKIAVSEEDSYGLSEGDDGFGYSSPDYFRFRNLRINYFAVKALQARANLYAGNNVEASTAAKVVINEASVWFPWSTPSDVISNGSNPDRIFSSEVLFALQNIDLYSAQQNYFSSDNDRWTILAPLEDVLDYFFESNTKDYRYTLSSWAKPTMGGKDYFAFFKFADIEDLGKDSRYMQPLIRMSEMYYIAAETETDPTMALNYINTVRMNRGIPDLPASVDLNDEIMKEYRKEFWGEGQLFYYYKRTNAATIQDGSYYWGDISMDASKYVLVKPLSETNYRD